MRIKSIFWIFVVFLLALPFVSAKSTVLFNETFDNSENWSLSGCTINNNNNGRLECLGSNQYALFVHKLLNLSTNTNNWTIEIYDFEVNIPTVNSWAFVHKTANVTSGTGGIHMIAYYSGWQLYQFPDDSEPISLNLGTHNNSIKLIQRLNESVDIYINDTYFGNQKYDGTSTNKNGTHILFTTEGDSDSKVKASGIVVYNGTTTEVIDLDITPPEILFYNMTSEPGGCTNWTTNKNNACTTADTTPTVKINTSESAYCAIGVTDSNYTGMNRNSSCSGEGTKKHTCTLDPQDELTEEVSYLYIGCKDTSDNENENSSSTSGALKVSIHSSDLERYGRSSIESGIYHALSTGYTIYTDQKIYARNSANNQTVGVFDKVVKWLNKIWAFNFLTGNDTYVNMFNITPVLYTLEMKNITNSTVNSTVYQFIIDTK